MAAAIDEQRASGGGSAYPLFVAALSGVDLVLVQYFLVREAAAQLFVNEGTSLLVVASFFLSFSLGYWLGARLERRALVLLGVATILLHWIFPWGLRQLTGWSCEIEFDWFNLFFVPGYLVLCASVYHGALLTWLAGGAAEHGCSIRKLYAADLAGAAAGVLGAIALLDQGIDVAWFVHLALLGLLVAAPLRGLRLALPGMALATLAVAAVYYPNAREWNPKALESFHHKAFSHENGQPCELLSSVFSPYNRVDVFEAPDGDRYLYLDSVLFFGTRGLTSYNDNLVGLPSHMLDASSDALIIGSGSMSSVGMLAPVVGSITTCEIDAKVAEAGREFFGEYNRLAEPGVREKWSFHADDGRHFLRSTEQRFDLIAFDVPAPSTIQLALLASPQVLALARARLQPGGMVSMSTSSTLGGSEFSHAVAASFLQVFPDVVYTEEREGRALGFLVGGEDLSEYRAFLRRKKSPLIRFRTREEIAELAEGHEPIGLTNLAAVREITLYRMQGRYGTD